MRTNFSLNFLSKRNESFVLFKESATERGRDNGTRGLGQFLTDPGDMPTRPEIKGRSCRSIRPVIIENTWTTFMELMRIPYFSVTCSLSFFLVLIKAGDKLLEATSETLATPRYFRGATMIQHQLHPRRRRRWRRRRRKRRIGYSTRNLLVKTETSIPRLDRIKHTCLLNGILDEVFHLAFRCVRIGISSIHFLLSYWTIVSAGSDSREDARDRR